MTSRVVIQKYQPIKVRSSTRRLLEYWFHDFGEGLQEALVRFAVHVARREDQFDQIWDSIVAGKEASQARKALTPAVIKEHLLHEALKVLGLLTLS